jgi:hypothetical protein
VKTYFLWQGLTMILLSQAFADELPAESVMAQQNETAPVKLSELAELPAIEQFDGITERPLFNASRRPKPKEAEQDEPLGEALLGKWRLSGIVTYKNEQVALFDERKGETHLRLNVGMPLDKSGTLMEIGKDYVLVDDRTESIRFELWEPRILAPEAPRQTKSTPEDGNARQSGKADDSENSSTEGKTNEN